jgi:hypothetical protein
MDGKERLPHQSTYDEHPFVLQLARTPPNKSPDILTVFNMLPGISLLNQYLFASRYIPLFKSYRNRSRYYALVFHSSRFIVTVGSITVPALLSLQSADNLKWLTWTISLAVTIFNGILTLFKIDKKYYYLHTVRGVLESEAYQFLSLAGRYGKTKDITATNSHAYQFPYFCIAMEKIRMKQIEEEYFKADNSEKNKDQQSQNKSEIVPPSASGQQSDEMKQWHESAVKQQVSELGAPITFSTPFFRQSSHRQPMSARNSIAPPWTCINCGQNNLAIQTKCSSCNIEHPDIINSVTWTCPTCNKQNPKSTINCPNCSTEEPSY